jgi:DeoR/GlpR family transcriptional regulator of sugar metabolism
MFAIERLNKIKEILYKEKRVDVVDLSERFSVTEVTIRRDLDKLEQAGFIVKTYGGAVLREEVERPAALFEESDDETAEEKRMIGKMAAELVEQGEAIFLGPGRTCREVARHLKGKRITVVTNDLAVGLCLKDAVGIKVILTGGDLLPSSTALGGGLALQALDGIYVNKAFVSVRGVHTESGFTMDSHEEVAIAQEVRKIAGQFIVVADYTKFGRIGFARLGELSIAAAVVTNKQIPAEYKQFFFENEIKLYTVFELK